MSIDRGVRFPPSGPKIASPSLEPSENAARRESPAPGGKRTASWETATMMQTIRCLRSERDITVVLVEHDMTALMGLSDYVFAISFGKKIAEGLPEEIVRNEHVIDAYLGTQQED